MSVKLEVNMTKKILYDFFMTHAYSGFSGWFSIVLGIAGIVLSIQSVGKTEPVMTAVYLIFSVYFLLYQPIALYMKALRQMKINPMFQEPIYYVVDEEGITTSQGGQSAKLPWDKVLRVRESKYSVLLYTGKISTFLLPKESIGEQMPVLKELIGKHVNAKEVKLK